MDKEILMILNDCNCLEHYSKLKGVTMAELRSLTPLELKSKLMTLLASLTDADAIASEITRNDFTKVKHEPIDVKPNIADLARARTREADDDEPLIVHQVPGDVSFVSVIIKAEESVEEVTIDDNDETMAEASDSGSYDSDENSAEAKPDWSRLPFLPTLTTMAEIAKGRPLYFHFFGQAMGHYSRAEPSTKRLKVRLSSEPADTSSEMGEPSRRFIAKDTRSKWRAIYRACGLDRIKFLDCDHWEWGPLDASSPRNLYPLLSQHCKNLSELTFCSNLSLPSTFSGPLTLPNLKVIRILSFEEVFAFSTTISDIIQATTAGKFKKLQFCCGNTESVRPFLVSLRLASGPQSGLRGLKSLTISSKCPKNTILVLSNEDFKILADLNCPSLRDLYLDCSVADDVQGPFEAFLKTVPKLKRFALTGCFRSSAVRLPRVKLVFPVLRALEKLELGRSVIRNSACDDLTTRPVKRAGRKPIRLLRVEDENAQGQSSRIEGPVEVPVTVSLPILPSLDELHFGIFFELDEIHLRSLPSLSLFYVGSPWNLALRLPSDPVRKRTFPKITNLQLPDQLEDDDFVRAVLPLFPNLRILFMNLPTVRVLRAVAWAMKSVKSFIYLGLTTQFDFRSSVDACFVDKPSELVLSGDEVKEIEILKEYKYWKEFVDFHGIQVPNSGIKMASSTNELPNSGIELPKSGIQVPNFRIQVPNYGIQVPKSRIQVSNSKIEMPNSGMEVTYSELGDLDDDTKYAGLLLLNKSVLNKTRFVLDMRHVVRRLRLPKGDLHWDDDACAFGDTLIGFQRFPVSRTVEKASKMLEISFFRFENKVYKIPEGFSTPKECKLGVEAGTKHSWASRSVKNPTE